MSLISYNLPALMAGYKNRTAGRCLIWPFLHTLTLFFFFFISLDLYVLTVFSLIVLV